MKEKKSLCYQNRELSWLTFNERILEEADDSTVPLLERLRFLAIYESNLNEFFMIRVGSLFDLTKLKDRVIDQKSLMNVHEQLDSIYTKVKNSSKKKDQIYQRILYEFGEVGIKQLGQKLSSKQEEYYETLFRKEIYPFLSPQVVDPHHPFPHLHSNEVYLGLWLEKDGKQTFGIVNSPSNLKRIYYYDQNKYFISVEKLIQRYIGQVFTHYIIKESTLFTITRNADIVVEEEISELEEDFLSIMKRLVKKRERLAPVKMEYSSEISLEFQSYLMKQLNLRKQQLFKTQCMFQLFEVSKSLEDCFSNVAEVTYPTFESVVPFDCNRKGMMKAMKDRDILLFYPYDSFDPFLRFLREAAIDVFVQSIKITIYRMAAASRLVDLLCLAAENGKSVTVMMELRARFDEENNMDHAQRLEESGCRIIYGYEQYKTHAKVCLVTKSNHGKIEYYTQTGTGNYHEKTSKLYTDYALFTTHQGIGEDANLFFQNAQLHQLCDEYKYIKVAPLQLKEWFIGCIDSEIAKAKKGVLAKIDIKANSLTEKEFIDKLIQAGHAGVHVRLLIRGISCLLPNDLATPNIEIHSIVGRFLEHSRVYRFGDQIYISSADPMTRNLQKRIEIATPILDERIKKNLMEDFNISWMDTIKGRKLDEKGKYVHLSSNNPLDSQVYFLERAQRSEINVKVKEKKIRKWIQKKLTKFIMWLE